MTDPIKYWNGIGGHAWVDLQSVIDDVFQPFTDLLIEPCAGGSVRSVLDVGCGAGGTTLAAARRLGASGRCVGIDISEPLIAAARARAEHERSSARFVVGDAQTYALEAGVFDLVMSRFGVLFFDDPVAAFANVRRAATVHGLLRFIAWRGPSENLFLTTPERAAAQMLPNLEPRRPDGPGAFAFADRDEGFRILADSGWSDITIQPIDVACTLRERDLISYFTRIGPLGRVFHALDDVTQARIVETVRAASEPYVHGTEVRFTAACWLVNAGAAS
ncbi:MAG TPA: class I SAM-dependent methyltransferase [Gemmatimonadaceae bacterium]|nr:class I SAM-dependent methyltransferase [Gemmatimonadaceae bacterium]